MASPTLGARLPVPTALGWIPVRGNSMWPSLRAGDEAGFAPAREAAPGDVVLARVGQAWVVHRVLAVEGATVRLRGDNCAQEDPPVPHEAVAGVVLSVRRNGRDLPRWDRGPRGLGTVRVRLLRAAGRLKALLQGRAA